MTNANPKAYDVIDFTGGHGLATLLNVKNKDGRYFIDNKLLTGFSNLEEVLANRKKLVPFMMENE